MQITADNVQCALGHDGKYVKFVVAMDLDGFFECLRAHHALLIEYVNETVENLKVESWCEKTAAVFPSGTCQASLDT